MTPPDARLLAALALAVSLAQAPAAAQPAPESGAAPESTAVAEAPLFAPNVETFTLDNGLEVVVIPDHRAPVATHMVWYKVGSADEPPGKSGIAHFLEHLMFKGTENNPEGRFSKIVAEIGGEENAFTSQDYTGYFQRVAKEHLPLVMELEADRMANLVLDEQAVETEREVILEERRQRVDNDPGSQLSEALSAAFYQAHPYGTPVIGWEQEMRGLGLADARSFYDRFYTPNNAVLVVAGDVTPDEVRRLAEETYGQVARRAEPGVRARVDEPEPRAERRVILRDARVRQPSFQRNYLVPSSATAEEGEAEALDVLAHILGGGPTSRLYRALAVEQGLASAAGAWYQSGALDETRFAVFASPRGDVSLDAIEAAIDAEIERVQREGVSAQEVERAKNKMIAEAVYAQDSQSTMARIFGSALTSGETVEAVQTWPRRIMQVTPADVQQAAERYLERRRSATGLLLPEAGDSDNRS